MVSIGQSLQLLVVLLCASSVATAFLVGRNNGEAWMLPGYRGPEKPCPSATRPTRPRAWTKHSLAVLLSSSNENQDEGVVELGDDPQDPEAAAAPPPTTQAVAPFISQGEIAEDVLNPDLADPKQARVIIYTVLSLLPVLFLIPLMLSRDLIPQDSLPPVDMGM